MMIVKMVNFPPQLEQAAPYEATFRSLRVSIDYSIKISFIIDGHTLGVVDFTIAAEDRSMTFFTSLFKTYFSTGGFLPQQHHQDSNPEKNRWHRRLSSEKHRQHPRLSLRDHPQHQRLSPEKHRQHPRLSLGDHPQHQRSSHARPQRHRLSQFPLFRRMLTRTLKRRAR